MSFVLPQMEYRMDSSLCPYNKRCSDTKDGITLGMELGAEKLKDVLEELPLVVPRGVAAG